MKLIHSLLTALALFSSSLHAETQYANVQLQAGVDVLYYSAYGAQGSEKETYPMELHWSGNGAAESFNFQLSCGSTLLESIWSRATNTFVRFTVGSDLVSRCTNLPIRAKITANNIPDVYLQVLDYAAANRPATTIPPLGTSCMGYTRLLKLNESETITPAANGTYIATCSATGMSAKYLTCNSNAILENGACRLGRSCGNTPHGRIYATTEGCKPIGLQVFYTSKCYDGTFSPAVRSEVTCDNPPGGVIL